MTSIIRAALAACAVVLVAGPAAAASSEEIESGVEQSLKVLYGQSQSAKEMAEKAEGILVFPSVYKAGIGLGGSYGEGALVVGNTIVDFYNIGAGSIGLQLGAQKESVVIMFMSEKALNKFRNSAGWKAGVDGSIAIIETGAGKSIDTATMQQPIVGFIFSNTGLMAGLTLEGSKITKVKK